MSMSNIIEIAAGVLLALAIVAALVALYVYRRPVLVVAQGLGGLAVIVGTIALCIWLWGIGWQFAALAISVLFAIGLFIGVREHWPTE